jgi:hypothetical protein
MKSGGKIDFQNAFRGTYFQLIQDVALIGGQLGVL